MGILAIFKPSNAADLLEIYGILFALLLVFLLLSEMYDWLKTKPWKKSQPEQTPPLINTSPPSFDTNHT